ncbi:hypothetical protein [Kingella negevensis]|uniref:Uncharacterized protein n=1 Tax=Kingella negevensis TaxID=1522312 RepID=A0A238HES3_9NEIS|nr:hypothetical protein [Kingella negevensis]MDK4681300.1 hypothetical protein [Kingella negevensis]MDK4683497.1 hypothetical protein [Kingella negevensis]MDK4684058.1 hypothetical protein [Kingella negevensis]MDK4689108.1 hypothetical protein [Kingella negevensis]MDK4691368.1 hypothetical protein [Kingella negevensis]
MQNHFVKKLFRRIYGNLAEQNIQKYWKWFLAEWAVFVLLDKKVFEPFFIQYIPAYSQNGWVRFFVGNLPLLVFFALMNWHFGYLNKKS